VLISVATYRAITGDATTSDVNASALIEEATEVLAEVLSRPDALEEAVRTERMHPTRDGRLWPLAVPITNAGGYTIDGYSLLAPSIAIGSIIDDVTGGIDVTYTGGWTAATVPRCIARDLAWAAYQLGQSDAIRRRLAVPAGAVGVQLGDAAVQFDRNAPGRGQMAPAEANIEWSKRTLAYRYQRIGSYPCSGRLR